MENMRKEINYHINNFKNIYKNNIKVNIVSINLYIHR